LKRIRYALTLEQTWDTQRQRLYCNLSMGLHERKCIEDVELWRDVLFTKPSHTSDACNHAIVCLGCKL
jgi:hypothetical protein